MNKLLFGLTFISAVFLCNRMYQHLEYAKYPVFNRNRIFKFALCQDLLVFVSILKMILIEGYSLRGAVQRIRDAGPATRLYLATIATLHGAVLLDESSKRNARLHPAPYTPATLRQYQVDLFLL